MLKNTPLSLFRTIDVKKFDRVVAMHHLKQTQIQAQQGTVIFIFSCITDIKNQHVRSWIQEQAEH